MPHTEDTTPPTQDQDRKPAQTDDTLDNELIVNGLSSTSSAPSANKPLRRGNRKSRPGAQAQAITKLGSIASAPIEEEIEMDDLPVKANAPQHLIEQRNTPNDRYDDADRPRRNDRSRGERRGRDDRERSPERRPERRRERSNDDTAPQRETQAASVEASSASADRPERFAMAGEDDKRPRPTAPTQEFRPSRDGRSASSRPAKRDDAVRLSDSQPAQKKGLLAKIIAFFTGGATEKPKPTSVPARERSPRRADQREGRDRRSGEGQSADGRDRSPRRRGKRRDGERNDRPERGDRNDSQSSMPRGEGEGGQRRRRRRRSGNRDGGPRREESRTPSE